MRIFYGVQGTGNGHITRARIMAHELSKTDYEVTFLFTGRPREQLFDMEVFGDYLWRPGLTFHTHNGRVSYFKTALKAKPLQFIHDIRSLDLSMYDVVLCDFEPVSAWAARLQKRPLIGIGHQYAFNHDIPTAGSDPLARQVMKYFAPVNQGIGLHWHHFDQAILPPIIDTEIKQTTRINEKIIVYLPFENQTEIVEILSPFNNFQFHIYAPQVVDSPYPHITVNALSRPNFQRDIKDCSGIISNAGFELASEALFLGKKLLVKPLHQQMEQISNARALEDLGYGQSVKGFDREVIEHWLHNSQAIQINYPNVAKHIVTWIGNGMPAIGHEWTKSIWKNVIAKPVLAKSP